MKHIYTFLYLFLLVLAHPYAFGIRIQITPILV